MPLLAASDVHDFYLTATPDTLRRVLTDPRSCTTSARLALQAVASSLDCDTVGAAALLRKALGDGKAHRDERPFLTDMLLWVVAVRGEFEELERLLGEPCDKPPRVAPSFYAAEAMLHAVRGRPVQSRARARQALALADIHLTPLQRGRVLQRCSVASYYCGDFDHAHELALDTARLFEQAQAYSSAVAAYSVAAAVASTRGGDASLVSMYYERMATNATLGGHHSLLRMSTAARIHLAAETFDVETFQRQRAALLSRPACRQYQERFVLLIAEVLGYGWDGKFATAEAVISRYTENAPSTQQQLAMTDALLSLIAAARWDVASVRRLTRLTLHRTAVNVGNEAPHEERTRNLARLLAAAACFLVGDRIRAERALSKRFDPDRRYHELLAARPLRPGDSPDMFRGYAEFARVAAEHADRARPRHGLTATEMQVLRLLRSGGTLNEVAKELRKSKSTVARQVESIYDKLDVRNRAHAVEKAREYGVLN